MNKGMLTVGIIMLALMGLLLINVISNYSTGNELDYYLVKETVMASIDDAVDVKYYRDNGAIRMDKDKFVESFLRRFADSVDNTRNYRVRFYDLNEVPPKVSVQVDSATVLTFDSQYLLMTTNFNGIVESTKKEDWYLEQANQINSDEEIGYATCEIKTGETTKYERVKTENECKELGGKVNAKQK